MAGTPWDGSALLLVCPATADEIEADKVVSRLAKEASADYVALSGLDAVLGIGSGFLPVGQRGPNMTVRLLGQQLTEDVTQFGAWAATFGDLELF